MKKSACSICDHNLGRRCGYDYDCFGSVRYPEDCDEFDYCDDDDDDDDDDDEDDDDVIECEQCGGDAYWNGSCYECEECGWCSD